jgi:polysaccharide pyruvyl transferase WcaK-like protein
LNILILNHCAHNKGDNSVLYYLSHKLKNKKKVTQLILSTSDGKRPFWGTNKIFDSICYWGMGLTFKEFDTFFLIKLYLKAKNYFYKNFVFKLIIWLYSVNNNSINKIVIKFFYNKKFLNEINNADAVISTGGHHISSGLDSNLVNAQLCDMVVTLVYEKKLMLWSQSIGPIETKFNFVRKSLKRLFNETKIIIPRDKETLRFLGKDIIKNKKINKCCPDSVCGITGISDINFSKSSNPTKNNALVCIYSAKKRKEKEHTKYVNNIAEILDFLSNKGIVPVLFPMQYKNMAGDEREILKEIIKKTKNKKSIIFDKDKSPKDTLLMFKKTNLVIGHKMHSVIYGLSLGVPIIAICYHKKQNLLMNTFGMKQYAINDKNLNLKKVNNKIVSLIKNKNKIRKKLRKHSLRVSKIVNGTFDSSFKELVNIK